MTDTTAAQAITGTPTGPLTGAKVGIPPRHIDFRFSEAPQRYFFFDQNPLASLVFVVFSGIFPPGERFFMESVRNFRDRITDPVLKAQVSGFMGQEALHGREHDRLNDFFRERGFDVDLPARYVRFGLRQLERFSPRLQLACTTQMEHFTAHLAEQWLTDKALAASSDPEMLKLWYWHALEELEHKSVAYDVFDLIGGTQRERKQAGWLVGLFIGLPVVASWVHLLVKEGQLFKFSDNRRGLKALFGRGALISEVLRHMPTFWRRKFHPSQQATQALEASWRERLFGPRGDLIDVYRNPKTAA
ncbi:metal-dependent hydrolase [Aquabacterium sp.]|uniref:metal-dependent hydrolase n=1 Tax=Aquabacterium sp. TaxID=1872578 RepID=UPI0024877044|nr:metal-dependent hydrolase [Aquabacterium sp.]MDI1350035.1 metal-dependent hydrolase [Aquabacterium sp.]